MKIYFAPLEGMTGYIYRRAYEKHFANGRIDKYFTPFIVPKEKTFLTTREIRDISMDNNQGMSVVPQILTNNAKGFLDTAHALKEQGYDTVNLNLGCPAGTVVSKGRGSGFLDDLKGMEIFFDEIMEHTDVKVSIKTRLGKEFPSEIEDIVDLFNKYDFEEWILHARVREDFYKNKPNLEAFSYAAKKSKHSIVYNGDIFTVDDFRKIKEQFPDTDGVMCGRGFIANPGLLGEIYGREPMTKETLKAFLDELQEGYKEIMSGDWDVLFRLKELWSYMNCMFEDSKKEWKRIRKSNKLSDYNEAVDHLFEVCPLKSNGGFTTLS